MFLIHPQFESAAQRRHQRFGVARSGAQGGAKSAACRVSPQFCPSHCCLSLTIHTPEAYSTLDAIDNMMAPNFWEIGASGRRYSREYVSKVLSERLQYPKFEKWISSGFHCQEITENNYLLTYLLQQGDRITQRSSIWRRTPKGWQILFHQGTIVNEL